MTNRLEPRLHRFRDFPDVIGLIERIALMEGIFKSEKTIKASNRRLLRSVASCLRLLVFKWEGRGRLRGSTPQA
ncbi:hypothetical protein M2480_000675 [Parabacteroides sp. PFB2-12]|nr:hypothetical protein [Parabacteroides sp. PM6-13]MDH6389710.1 hypothetical protein [Parabacteroides sp. PFB2-12]